jgi:amino acid transporter
VFVPIGVASIGLGIVYGLTNFALYGRIPNGAVILILFAVIVFLVGLISEQISSLRFDGQSRS